jgi:serine/threonine protein kinase
MQCLCLSSNQGRCKNKTRTGFVCYAHFKKCKAFFDLQQPSDQPCEINFESPQTTIEWKSSKIIKVFKCNDMFACVKFKKPFSVKSLTITEDKRHTFYDWHEYLFLKNDLKHTNIISVLNAGVHNNQIYIVFPLYNGNLLALPKIVVDVTKDELNLAYVQMLEALTYIQSKEILHRDICARNILFRVLPMPNEVHKDTPILGDQTDNLMVKRGHNGRLVFVLADFDLAIILDPNARYRLTPSCTRSFVGKRAMIVDNEVIYVGDVPSLLGNVTVPIGFHKDVYDLKTTFQPLIGGLEKIIKLDFGVYFKTKRMFLFFAKEQLIGCATTNVY